jgi:hypothetical protein
MSCSQGAKTFIQPSSFVFRKELYGGLTITSNDLMVETMKRGLPQQQTLVYAK